MLARVGDGFRAGAGAADHGDPVRAVEGQLQGLGHHVVVLDEEDAHGAGVIGAAHGHPSVDGSVGPS
ncbi:hypothetical protein GCM10027258_85900 [Amycolatopsis stemonae]